MEKIPFFDPFEKESFSSSRCFLCGNECGEETAEHVFPKWLQKKYGLWGQSLKIGNDSTIQYRHLTIPCCAKCNNADLSKMEVRFRDLLNRKFQGLNESDQEILFQWSAKIIYATRYKELFLKFDRREATGRSILEPEELESYSAMHLFLQSVRINTIFENPRPWSTFIFQCDDDSFFYHSSTERLCFSMKLGKVAFVVIFEENNLLETKLQEFKSLPKLNFAQYLEASSRLFYFASLRENTPKYVSHYNKETQLLTTKTFGGISFGKWHNFMFSTYFESLLESCEIDYGDKILQDDGSIHTFLIDHNGKPLITV